MRLSKSSISVHPCPHTSLGDSIQLGTSVQTAQFPSLYPPQAGLIQPRVEQIENNWFHCWNTTRRLQHMAEGPRLTFSHSNSSDSLMSCYRHCLDSASHAHPGPQHDSFSVKQVSHPPPAQCLRSHLSHLAQACGLESPGPPNLEVPDGSQ